MSKRPRPPLSPEAAAVVRAMSAGRLSRRSMLGGAGAVGAGALLAACGTKGTSTGASTGGALPTATVTASNGAVVPASDGPSPATDRSATEKLVRWANWTLYLDYDEASKTYPTLVQFTKETGIKATYAEDIDDNDSYYGKIQAQLRKGQDMGKDLIVMTDWMASRLVSAGWVQKLDQTKIPNGKNILPKLKDIGWDKGRNYSYTWQSGYAGLGFNVPELKKLTGKTKITTIDELWDPKLKGRVEVLSEMRDTIGLILLSQGVDIESTDKPFTSTQWENAIAVLEKQLSNGQIRQVKGNSYKEDLVSKDAVAVIGWSGDLLQLNLEAAAKNPADSKRYGFELPTSGGTLWSDNLMIPVGSPHKTNAEILINYYYDPAVAAQVANYVNYICPVEGAQEAILKIKDVDPAVANSPLIFPTEAYLKNVHQFRELTTKETTSFTAGFQKVLGV